MNSHFTSDFFIQNRQRLRELFTGTAPIVITANGLLQRAADGTYAFSQDAYFWYLTGINEPDIVLVMDRDKEYFIVPARSASREAFDGAISHDTLAQRSGVQQVYESDEGWQQLGARLKKVKHAAVVAVPPAYIEQYGMYTNPARGQLIQRMREHNAELELLDVSPHITRLRMIKQPSEIAALEEAIAITAKTLKSIIRPKQFDRYEHEYEIEADITRGFRRLGSAGHAFEPIVAGGERACTLHNVANNGKLAAQELVVIDVGAEVEHYAADITRTVSLGEPTRRQQTVYDAVLEVQQYALSLLRPGTLLREYEQSVEQFMGEKLRELGLIKMISHEEVRMFYPHATSHFLGLNVHDVGEYDRPIEAGTVLTVEPGMYIPAEGIGVRIEDDVLITNRGVKVLSRALPRSLR